MGRKLGRDNDPTPLVSSSRSMVGKTSLTIALFGLMLPGCAGSSPSRKATGVEMTKPSPCPQTQHGSSVASVPWHPPDSFDCVIRDSIEPHDVAWGLRARHDAVPSMKAHKGKVTAWLIGGPPRHEDYPMAVVQIENEAMVLHGFVRREDLLVIVTEPVVLNDTFVADGKTNRRVLGVAENRLFLQFVFEEVHETTEEVACEQAGLSRRELDLIAHLPPSQGRLALRKTSSLATNAGPIPASELSTGVWATQPEGVVVNLHLRGASTSLVSGKICGGLAYGMVDGTDLLGPVQNWHGSSSRCPNTGETHHTTEPKLAYDRTCIDDVPVSVRTSTLEDSVGVIRRGARLRIVEEQAGTAVVVVADAPVRLLPGARFTVLTPSLSSCH